MAEQTESQELDFSAARTIHCSGIHARENGCVVELRLGAGDGEVRSVKRFFDEWKYTVGLVASSRSTGHVTSLTLVGNVDAAEVRERMEASRRFTFDDA